MHAAVSPMARSRPNRSISDTTVAPSPAAAEAASDDTRPATTSAGTPAAEASPNTEPTTLPSIEVASKAPSPVTTAWLEARAPLKPSSSVTTS